MHGRRFGRDIFTVEVSCSPACSCISSVLIISSGLRIPHLLHGDLKEVEIDPSVTWIAIADMTVIAAVTVTVITHVEMLPRGAVLLSESGHVLVMHLPPVGMNAMADVGGAIADLPLVLVPQEEEGTGTEVAAPSPATGKEIVTEMSGMIETTEMIYETCGTMVMTSVLPSPKWPS